MKIFKFPLDVCEDQCIRVPADAQVVSLQTQNGVPCLWVLLDPKADKERRVFYTVGTGHDVPENAGAFVGTYQYTGGLVFHVFEGKR